MDDRRPFGRPFCLWSCDTAEHAQQPDAATTPTPPVTKAQADRWMTELSNWGRWGKDDQLGALNLITPEKRRQAMALAKTGTVISLERKIVPSKEPEETRADGKPHGISFFDIRFKTFPPGDPRGNDGFSSDIQESHVHGPMTHLDALCHDSANGKLYNGFPLKETVSQEIGCTKVGTRQPQGRHRHSRCLDRHDAPEEPARCARHARLRGGHRSLGKADRPEGVVWRCAVCLQPGTPRRAAGRRRRGIRLVGGAVDEGAASP